MSCCDVNGLNGLFRGLPVHLEARRFKRHGPSAHQLELIAQLGPARGKTVTEVGCGVGAISTTLLKEGAARAQYVDVSRAYLVEAARLAAQAGVGEKASFHNLDFAAAGEALEATDTVVADRVLCCYPDAERLVAVMARQAKERLVLTLPQPGLPTRFFRGLMNTGMRLLNRDYRFYLHDPERVKRVAERHGLRLQDTRALGVWRLMTFTASRS